MFRLTSTSELDSLSYSQKTAVYTVYYPQVFSQVWIIEKIEAESRIYRPSRSTAGLELSFIDAIRGHLFLQDFFRL